MTRAVAGSRPHWVHLPKAYWKPDAFKRAPYNPRKITAAEREAIKRGIRNGALLGGLDARDEDGLLIGGHQRLDVCLELIAEFEDDAAELERMNLPGGKIPVNPIRGVTDAEAMALNVLLNNPKAQGSFDMPMLTEVISQLDATGFDATFTGFDDREIRAMLTGHQPPPPAPASDLLPVNPITKPGDVVILGEHRLMCGDATDHACVDRLMAGARAQMAITSPQYNAGALELPDDRRTHRKYDGDDDVLDDEGYTRLLGDGIASCLRAADVAWINLQVLANNRRPIARVLGHYAAHWKDVIYWVKTQGTPHIQPGVMNSRVELLLAFARDENPTRSFALAQWPQGTFFNVIEGPAASAENEFWTVHKATFPLYVPRHMIESFTRKGDLVVDLFAGTGTTLIAAHDLGRICYVMDINPAYCDLMIDRWERHTGQTAERPGDRGAA